MKKLYFILFTLIASCPLMAMEESPSSMHIDFDSTVSITSDIEKIREAALEEIKNGQYGRLKPFLLEFFAHAHDSSFNGSSQDFIALVYLAVNFKHKNVISFLKQLHILEEKLIEYIYIGPCNVIQLLVRAGADVNYIVKYRTPLFAALNSDLERTLKLLPVLINAGAHVNQLDQHQETALFNAEHATVVEFMLLHGADIDLPTKGAFFRYACATGKEAIVRYLMDLPQTDLNYVNQNSYDKDLHKVEYSNCTPLSAAIYMNRLEIVQLLVEHGANINGRDPRGWTPIMQASAYGDLDIVNLLLDRGGDFAAVNDDGKTALDLAVKRKNKRTAKKKDFKQIIKLLKAKE